jgi:hypothetical protein
MQTIRALAQRIYCAPAYIAVIPPLAVSTDYALTFFLAGNTGMILQWETSPLVRFAVAHNSMALYFLALIIFYYAAAYAVLRILHTTAYYRFGVGLVLLVSLIHVLGGLSWQVKAAWYSNSIAALSFLSVIIAICLFGYSFLRQARSSP